jgi:hypothetical protein
VKKKINKTLKLSKETLRNLGVAELKQVGGGASLDACGYTNICTTYDTCTTQQTSHNTCGSAYC